MKWNDALKDYLQYLKIERGLSKNSIDNYSFDIKKLIKYLDKNALNHSPITITTDTIQPFIYTLSKTLNTRTQSRMISGLKGFFNYLIFEDYRTTNPIDKIDSPKIGRKLPDVLSEQEINKLINAINLSQPEGERNRAILETLYGCGLRVSELTNLKISDLFFNEDFIKINGKGNKQRLIPIMDTTKKFINIYKQQSRIHLRIDPKHTDILFLNRRGKQLTRAMIFTIVKQLAVKINLNKTVSPHSFRHSFATHLLKNGADLRAIQLMMGHENITTTEIYTHLDKSHLKQVIENFHPRQ